jgi:hypothetical protein
MKGRKGKKGSKLAAKNVAAPHDRQSHQQAQQPASASQSQSQGTQSEECYEDEYDEDYPRDEPLPSPTAPPIPRRQEGDPSHVRKRSAIPEAASYSEKLVS